MLILAFMFLSNCNLSYLCSRVGDDGPSLFWNKRDLTYAINSDLYNSLPDERVRYAIEKSFLTWQEVYCSDINFSSSLSDSSLVGYDWRVPTDNENLIVFRNGASDDKLDKWRHDERSMALTTTTFNSLTGEILDSDIEFNGVNFKFSACEPQENDCFVSYDIQNILTHEIGHFLGLDHPPKYQTGASETTMYYLSPKGELKKRSLHIDDINALCFIYPEAGPKNYCYDFVPRDKDLPIFNQVDSSSDLNCTSSKTSNLYYFILLYLLFFRYRYTKKRAKPRIKILQIKSF